MKLNNNFEEQHRRMTELMKLDWAQYERTQLESERRMVEWLRNLNKGGKNVVSSTETE